MTARPILFSAPMVRAILAGTKTQTRRVVKPVGGDEGFVLQDYGNGWWPYRSDDGESTMKDGNEIPHACPYGQPGDLLWVRETWAVNTGTAGGFLYRADHPGTSGFYKADLKTGLWTHAAGRWRPSIHMPRAASRITREVADVRVQRLNDISDADAAAEGWPGFDTTCLDSMAWFSELWESINGPGSWDANPWVWVVEFKRAQVAA